MSTFSSSSFFSFYLLFLCCILRNAFRFNPKCSHADLPKTRQRSSMLAARKLSSPDTSTYHHHSNVLGNNKMGGSSTTTGAAAAAATNTFSAVVVKSSSQLPNSKLDSDTIMKNEWHTNRQHEFTLGHLDGLVSSPNRCSKVRVADSRKIAAILLETNIVELQRHLLTITVQNQVSPIKHTLHSRTVRNNQRY